jgi:hypothetical protein
MPADIRGHNLYTSHRQSHCEDPPYRALGRLLPDTGKSPVYDIVARTHIAMRNVHRKGQTNRQVVTPAYFEK